MQHPMIIQGGMGAGVSGWKLARAVAVGGHLGVVSGTALDAILVRYLQDGDPEGHFRRALAHFPLPEVVKQIIAKFYIPGGRPASQPYQLVPIQSVKPSPFLQALTVVANFVEVWLAKEGHEGKVGINFLEKIQLPNMASIYGAMLAGVDYVLMGAGIPREIPGVIDRLVDHQPVQISLEVKGARPGEHVMHFNPADVLPKPTAPLNRPQFLAIIASTALASVMAKKSTGKVNGFVIEHYTAGGHNAPPRGPLKLDDRGEPIYGPKDQVNLEDVKALGIPFWLAGTYGHPARLQEALKLGAVGVQMGTAFAFCRESCLTPQIKHEVLERVMKGTAAVRTDPRASPTGYPFKVVDLDGSMSDRTVYENRERRCDLGYLRQAYQNADGGISYRCPGETEAGYLQKGGLLDELDGRKCLCNGLVANIGMGQVQPNGYLERPIVTAGDDLPNLRAFLRPDRLDYTAQDVLAYMLSQTEPAASAAEVSTAEHPVT